MAVIYAGHSGSAQGTRYLGTYGYNATDQELEECVSLLQPIPMQMVVSMGFEQLSCVIR